MQGPSALAVPAKQAIETGNVGVAVPLRCASGCTGRLVQLDTTGPIARACGAFSSVRERGLPHNALI